MSEQRLSDAKPVRITVYRVTGKQLFFRVPERVCVECDLGVSLVRSVVRNLGAESQVEVTVKPWINNVASCLLWRSWHPPVVTINGKRFSQGVVPDTIRLSKVLRNQLRES